MPWALPLGEALLSAESAVGYSDAEAEAASCKGREAQLLRRRFLLLAVTFGITHGAVTTPIGYASSVLQREIGDWSNGLLYGVTMVTSLLLAPCLGDALGPKWGLVLGMLGYSAYAACFAAASEACSERWPAADVCAVGGATQWAWAVAGSVLGGLGAGLLWPCQGVAFARMAEGLAEASGAGGARGARGARGAGGAAAAAGAATAELSSVFAACYLVLECVAKAMFTILQSYLNMKASAIIFLYSGLALASTFVLACSADVWSRRDRIPRTKHCSSACAAVRLWADPKLSLLMLTNLTYGFSVAWLNGYVNPNYLVVASSDTKLIGFLGAFTALVAAGSSEISGWVSARHGKMLVMLVGSFSFFGVGALSLLVERTGGPSSWGYGILAFYVLQGLGRGVYESTNKAVFADFFAGPRAPGAFANVMMQSTLSSAASFSLQAVHVVEFNLYCLIFFSCATYPCLRLAGILQTRERLHSPDSSRCGTTCCSGRVSASLGA